MASSSVRISVSVRDQSKQAQFSSIFLRVCAPTMQEEMKGFWAAQLIAIWDRGTCRCAAISSMTPSSFMTLENIGS